MVIHGYRAVFMVFKVPGPLNVFFLIPGWSFMIPGGFLGFFKVP